MKRTLLALALFGLATASWAQWEWPNGITPKRPQLIIPENMGTRALGTSNPAYLPHKGAPHILTILVNYADSAFSVNNPKKAFDQFFNATGTLDDLGNGNFVNHGSVSKYFSDMSNGAFTPVFDVYGPVTLRQKMAYYGGKAGSGNDERPGELVADALAAITDSVKEASVFDSNGDKYIDCIYIIYAGPGQNFGGGENTVWAKTSWTNSTFKGLKTGWYSMAGELCHITVNQMVGDQPKNTNNLITGVGVTCHELSHAMGLPDIYPTSSAYVDNQEMEYWDLMDGGEYVMNGFCPTPYTSWEKNLMGWTIDIKTLSASQDVTMSQSTEVGGKAYKIQNSKNAQEYFLLENIQNKNWSRYIPGHGLLVYHVNEDATIYVGTHLNNTLGKPGMAVVPADGACLSSYLIDHDPKADKLRSPQNYHNSHKGDPFPGTSNVTALNDTLGLPNFWWYTSDNDRATKASSNGETYKKVNMALKDISEADGAVSFSFIADFATGIRNINADRQKDDSRIFSLDGRYLGNNLYTLPHGIYIRGGRKIIK